MFTEGWVGEIFSTSVDQLKINELTTVPLVEQYSLIALNLVEAWYKLCVEYDAEKNGEMDFERMRTALVNDFLPEHQEMLAGGTQKP